MEFYLSEGGVRTKLPYGELDISGNEDYGFRPFQLMVASVAGCSASVFRKILDKKRITIDDLEIFADVERSSEEANKITAIHLRYAVKGVDLKRDQMEKSLELARKNCSMIRTIEDSVKITEKLEVINLSK
ncbi:OsmC/Ohr family protein [Gracilibacillus boraciitolerans JCM 21714]|uniref:OsmC/Ohr family protein n=1 Tax=Gracilibacillus boraciitolerans JCM 21714 TaxID=1298598 RepID=W4VPM7_9BACI|nr:OsmC family protein [Gracilibacillus boraciitolerans]GAE95330.1 OsmC/Ohr family protein [Gracilibacillus boraciitolerans JCM 21714]